MIRKKEKSKLNVLLEYYKLPNYLKGSGGDMIFSKIAVKSRKEMEELRLSKADAHTQLAFKTGNQNEEPIP